MAKTKKNVKELDLIKDDITGDSQLTTLDFMLSDCKTQQAKFDKLDEVCEIIAGCKISKHDLYINILCYNYCYCTAQNISCSVYVVICSNSKRICNCNSINIFKRHR